MVWVEPGTNWALTGAAANDAPSRLTSSPGGDVCNVTAVSVRAVLFRRKPTELATPATDAVTVYVPAVPFAVKTGAVATPCALVVAAALELPPNLPEAPPEGAVKVTVALGSGLADESLAVASRPMEKAELTAVLCPPPAVTEMPA